MKECAMGDEIRAAGKGAVKRARQAKAAIREQQPVARMTRELVLDIARGDRVLAEISNVRWCRSRS